MNKYKDYVAVIDSGVGGLDILNEIINNFKNENLVFVGDNENVPYGIKTKEELEKIGTRIVKYLEKQGVKLILIACNTLSINAIEYMRTQTKVPIYGIIRPTVRGFLNNKNLKSVLVLATPATVNAKGYLKFFEDFDKSIEVYQQAAPKLVEYIEAGRKSEIDEVLKEYIDPYKDKIDAIILGCTHFPIVKENIERLYPDLVITDSRKQMVQLLVEKLEFHDIRNTENDNRVIKVIATGSIDKLIDSAKDFFDFSKTITMKEEI